MDSNPDRPSPQEYVTHLAQAEETWARDVAAYDRAYKEIQRRDGAAEQWAKLWRTAFFVTLVALLMHEPVIAYLALMRSQVQAFVQPVQVSEDGKMAIIGVPKDLLAYEPEDGQWMEMLQTWVTKRRWRGDEENMRRTMNDYDWLLRHSCGHALAQLRKEMAEEGLTKPTKIRTSVSIVSTQKTQTPLSYQVNFLEHTQEHEGAEQKKREWIGTFTVGRVRPKTLKEAEGNPLGWCATGYGFQPAQGRKS